MEIVLFGLVALVALLVTSSINYMNDRQRHEVSSDSVVSFGK